jgi:hypothetical protein
MSMTPQQERDAILAAWNTWVITSNAATTDAQCADAFKQFVAVVRPIAVNNGHPNGTPRRKLG